MSNQSVSIIFCNINIIAVLSPFSGTLYLTYFTTMTSTTFITGNNFPFYINVVINFEIQFYDSFVPLCHYVGICPFYWCHCPCNYSLCFVTLLWRGAHLWDLNKSYYELQLLFFYYLLVRIYVSLICFKNNHNIVSRQLLLNMKQLLQATLSL